MRLSSGKSAILSDLPIPVFLLPKTLQSLYYRSALEGARSEQRRLGKPNKASFRPQTIRVSPQARHAQR